MLLNRVDGLIKEKNMSRAELERKLQLSGGSIRNWDKSIPSGDKIQKVADYFDVSTDYLLGRTDKKNYYELTEKDEKDIQVILQGMIDDLSSNGALSFSKEDGEMDEATRELLIMSLENSLHIAKREAKKKFTPKKYRNWWSDAYVNPFCW